MAEVSLPFDIFRYTMTFKDPVYEKAFTGGTPSAVVIKELKFLNIGDAMVVRPKQSGAAYFLRNCPIYSRSMSLCFELSRFKD